jgi:zinc protease
MIASSPRGLAPVRHELATGAVIIAKEARATPAVAINATFEAGSVCDPPGLPGVANFVSRMLDRGTRHYSADALATELDNRGVSLALAINRHIISISCTCLAEDFDDVLALVGEVAMRPTFPDEEMAIRRNEIVTTIRQDDDSPAAVAVEELLQLLYPGHPYSWRPRGTPASVEQITRADLTAFHAARFSPSSLSLVVVGDIDAAAAVASAEGVFGGWSAAAPAPIVLPKVQPATSRRRLVRPMMNKAQADVAYGFTTIVRADPAYYACSLMNNVLGQYSLGGRLGDSIREKQGMAYYVFSALDANVIEGPLMIRAGVSPANVERAIASIDAEVDRMAAEGPTEKELAESKQFLVGSMPRTLETNVGIANFLQMVEFFDLGLDYDVRLPGLLGRVSRDEVQEAARRLLDSSRAAVVIAGPYNPSP